MSILVFPNDYLITTALRDDVILFSPFARGGKVW
jgi:hypothetical protein